MPSDATRPAALIADVRHEGLRIAGQVVGAGRAVHTAVHNPFTGQLVGTVPKAPLAEVRQAFAIARAYQARLTRFERANILSKAAVSGSYKLLGREGRPGLLAGIRKRALHPNYIAYQRVIDEANTAEILRIKHVAHPTP